MPKSKSAKKQTLDKLTQNLDKAKVVIFAQFNKLTVLESEKIRNELRAEQAEMLVAKKTLIKKSLGEDVLKEGAAADFTGQIAAFFSYGDEVSAAKIIDRFRAAGPENKDKINFLGGFLDKQYLSAAAVQALAGLPSTLELRVRLVGSLAAPMSGLANVLAGVTRNFLYCLNNLKEKKANG